MTTTLDTLIDVPQQRLLRTAVPGPRSRELHGRRASAVADGFGVVLPVFVERAAGAVIVDVDGNQLIDLASGIAVTSVGASHPRVAEAVAAQARAATHTCFMVTEYDGFVEVCEALTRLAPGSHAKKAALFTTGAEAVENAVKIARSATGRQAVVTLGHAYHGRTLLTMAMTAKNTPYKDGFGPFAPEVYRAPSPYAYRWPTGPENAATEAFEALTELVTKQLGAHNVAAIVVEPVQGEGGFIPMPAGYLASVAAFAKEHGILFVADEIQSGMGRTGAMFAVEHDGVVPDLMTVAKALAGGMPLSAVVGRAEIMDAVAPGGLGGTYAGNPVACAAALAAIGVIEDEDLVGRARHIESVARPRLESLRGPSSPVGDVRGRGAMLAMEIVRPGTREPEPLTTKAIAQACHAEGVLVLTCGTFDNVIRLLPPLVISDRLLTDALDVVERAVRSVA
ncbi:4-aminobutyrate aminotransferase [Nostocoides japonicum T1-X7]|uniref:(S)-3-amino-2-methylpropionate transaminase n=1 Tax=Nostocoides japonicum T1-X7 TaxID=1194083 RepID=A0A077M6C5_9MICO|nr:4-aminobutyrate--2-oxoglutarate transaminase [Tetrasphaera japonica]CCH79684.1 4-aminobutyrate aminotransferase [Tetrasphaera japonica T1-X7]